MPATSPDIVYLDWHQQESLQEATVRGMSGKELPRGNPKRQWAYISVVCQAPRRFFAYVSSGVSLSHWWGRSTHVETTIVTQR